MTGLAPLWGRYRMRVRRRWLLFWALRARHQLSPVALRLDQIRPGSLLAVTCLRNEATRLPWFLDHHRKLGIDHFLMVENASDDGSRDYLAAQPDVSLWTTAQSYKASRFGMDWLGWLLMRYGHGHWCLTLDTDEALIYPGHDRHDLRDLTAWLDRAGLPVMGASMLDMYPRGPLADQSYRAGDNPFDTLSWFDPGPYRQSRQEPMGNLWQQGGPRDRVFFAETPDQAPTLNKIPLARWNRRWAYANSTHSLLPRELNLLHDPQHGPNPTGILLHSKFLPEIIDKSREEKYRGEHFRNAADFEGYYDGLIASPDLWYPGAKRLEGWQQLVDLGLMRDLDWGAHGSI